MVVTDHNVIVVPSLDKMSRLDDIESSVSAQLYFVPHYCFPQLLCCFTALISFRQANIPLSCTSNNVDECPLTCCLEPYLLKLVCTALILHLFSLPLVLISNKHLLYSILPPLDCLHRNHIPHPRAVLEWTFGLQLGSIWIGYSSYGPSTAPPGCHFSWCSVRAISDVLVCIVLFYIPTSLQQNENDMLKPYKITWHLGSCSVVVSGQLFVGWKFLYLISFWLSRLLACLKIGVQVYTHTRFKHCASCGGASYVAALYWQFMTIPCTIPSGFDLDQLECCLHVCTRTCVQWTLKDVCKVLIAFMLV